MRILKILKRINPKKYGPTSNYKILEGRSFPLDKTIEGKFEWDLIEFIEDEVVVKEAQKICPQGWELGKIDHLHSINPKLLLTEIKKQEALKYVSIMALGSTEEGTGMMIEFPILRYDAFYKKYLLLHSICHKKYKGERNDFLLVVKKIC